MPNISGLSMSYEGSTNGQPLHPMAWIEHVSSSGLTWQERKIVFPPIHQVPPMANDLQKNLHLSGKWMAPLIRFIWDSLFILKIRLTALPSNRYAVLSTKSGV